MSNLSDIDVSYGTTDDCMGGAFISTPLSLGNFSRLGGKSRPVSAKSTTNSKISYYSSIGSFGMCPICGGEFSKPHGSFELPVSTLIKLAEYHVAIEARKKLEL